MAFGTVGIADNSSHRVVQVNRLVNASVSTRQLPSGEEIATPMLPLKLMGISGSKNTEVLKYGKET